MKTLLLMIILVVTLGVELLIPDPDKNLPGTAVPGTVQPTASAPEDEDTHAIVKPVITQSAAQETSVPEPTVTPRAETIRSDADLQTLFGDPSVTDDFERGSSGFGINAGLNDDEAIRMIALNNRVSLEPKKDNGWITWRLRPPMQTDGAAVLNFSITTCARGDRTGVIMHSPDYANGHGYYFSLACEGTVSILRDTSVIASADVHELFNSASGQENVLTAVIIGNTLTAMLNGVPAVSVQDDTYTSGFAGFFTAPQGQGTLTMDVISFTEYAR